MVVSKDSVTLTCDWQSKPTGLEPSPESFVAERCSAEVPGSLILRADGTWFAVPSDGRNGDWVNVQGPGGVVFCRCPAHPFDKSELTPVSQLVKPATLLQRGAQVGPAGLRAVNGAGRRH